MKTLLLLSFMALMSSTAFAKDCASSAVKYRKATDTYQNVIAQRWACAVINEVPAKERDTNPLVKECAKNTTFYKEVNADEDSYCIRLDDSKEETQDFILVEGKLSHGVPTYTYQATKTPAQD